MDRSRPWRWFAIPVLALPISWVLFTGLGHDPRDIPSPLVGRPMPSFGGETLDGGVVSSADLAGKAVLVNFWASWCTPCIEEHPLLLDAADRFAGELVVVGVLYNDDPASARDFLARWGDGAGPDLIDADGRVAVDFGVTGPPESFLVDAAGIVRARHIGPLTAEVMDEQLSALGLDR
jgi:cytochrome c biogenesis protein CcmG, thiol:disulfide interchange protein DsbE